METLTFLFTDIEGSTALLGRLGEDAYAQVLAGHHALIRSALAAHDGREMDTQGDAFFAVFSSPRACVAAVLQMQQAIQDHIWPGGQRVRVRMGIHCGEAARTATGLVGLEVHRAARVAAVAYGGQVLVSETAAALVRDGLPPGAALADLGLHRLKDLSRPERIFQLTAAGLRAEFPPLRSLGNPALPNNLPAQLSTFIGRDREVAEVRALMESCRLVTLAGAGGCGKTRLGLQVAAELLDGSGDGVWLVELAAVTEQDAVALAISRALRLAVNPGRPVLEALLDALAPQDVLIVVDNCEHLIGGCAKTAEAIVRRCPRVHLLATSREPLGIGGEAIYRVPSLSLPGPADSAAPAPGSSDAVALFADRARANGVALDVDEQAGPLVVSVCRRLDGMPLAIELAAARLRSMSLAELHDRLDQRFRLLTGGSRTALERQQTLAATVGWSYSLLTGAEQVLLGRLSVFAGGFGLDAAEAVCGSGRLDVLDVASLLGSLVDKSLVAAERAGAGLRYRLLETIRLFAAERLLGVGGEEAAAVAAAHCAHFLSLAETAAAHLTGPQQGSWLARLDADQANLQRAAGYAAGRPDGTALVLRLGVALDRYWWARSREQEAFGLLVPVLRRPDARADPALFAAALDVAAVVAFFIDLATARQLAEQAVQVSRQLGDERLLSGALGSLCGAHFFAGEPETARRFGQESVERARRLGGDVQLAQSLLGYLLTIDPARSGHLYAEAIACTERSGDHLTNSVLHHNAAAAALEAGDIPAARAHLEAAAQAGQQIGYEVAIVPALLGLVLRAERHLDGARSTFEAALRIGRRNGDNLGMAFAILGLACLAGDAGDWERAAGLHGAAQAVQDRTGNPWQEFDACYRRDSLDQARAHLGDEQLERTYAQGMALSLEKALDLALRRPDPGWLSQVGTRHLPVFGTRKRPIRERRKALILVIGGRSKIGAALIGELLGLGQQVRALVRAGEPADRLPATAEAVTGDLANEGSLVTAMAGIEKVFLLSSPHPDAVSWHRNAIDAAHRTQVQLLVRSSILGADRESPAEFISAHTACDRYLEGSGLPYVIVRPNLFLQNILESTIPSISTSGTFYVDAGEARISMVDTRDVAAVAAVALTEPGHAGAHYDVTGPEALSYADVAARLTSALGRRISYAGASDDAVRQALLDAGLTEWFASALIGLYQDYRRSGTDGYAAQVTGTVPRLTGRPARSLDDLLGEIAPGLSG